MKERFEVLDIFRGIFASLVVFFHMSAFSATPIINNNFIYNSDLFVDFFFVLSGFVIAYSYQYLNTGAELAEFYKKRFFRLYPLHLAILLLFVIVELSKYHASGYVHVNRIATDGNNVTTFITNLLLLNSVKLPGVHDVSWNIASWSISAEMIAYLVFGLMVTFINRNNLAKVRNVFYMVIVAVALSALYFIAGGFNLMHTFDYAMCTFDYGFLRGLAGFFAGVVCFNIYNFSKLTLKSKSDSVFTILEIVSVFLIIILGWYGFVLKPYCPIYEALFFVTVLIFACEKGWLSKQLKKPVLLHKMGQYSYSIYMIHTLLLSLFNIVFIRLFKLPLSSYAYLFIVNYIIIYLAASWTFKHIEMRFNLSNKQRDKKGWWLW
jgi:peptidoglycan/LPS O-acetylase OafA/YrhL